MTCLSVNMFINWTKASDWFWARVSASSRIDERGLGALRIFSGLFLLTWLSPTVSWLGDAPPAFFDPPLLSLAFFAPGFPSAALDSLLTGITIVLTCMMTLGVYARVSTFALVLLGIAQRNFKYSFGTIDHDIMLWIFLGCMAFSGWGRTLAVRRDRPSRFESPAHAGAIAATALAFGFFSAGFDKALVWVDFDLTTSGFLSWFYPGYFVLARQHLLAPLVFSFPAWMLESIDYGAVAFELSGFVWLLLGPTCWRAWLFTAGVFHLSNVLMLNIPFDLHLLAFLAFADLSRVQATLTRWLVPVPARIAAAVLFGALVIEAGVSHWSPVWVVAAGPDLERSTTLGLYASVVFWIVGLTVLGRSVLVSMRRTTPQPRRAPEYARGVTQA